MFVYVITALYIRAVVRFVYDTRVYTYTYTKVDILLLYNMRVCVHYIHVMLRTHTILPIYYVLNTRRVSRRRLSRVLHSGPGAQTIRIPVYYYYVYLHARRMHYLILLSCVQYAAAIV